MDTMQKEQSDFQTAFKQEKANDGNAMQQQM